jgi:serine/threonine protein kinase
MRQVCDGVSYIHGQGIYHRDIKPANVLRVGSDTWAVSDFGLAREADRTTTALTSTLDGLGTFFYAAPELFQGARDATAEADVFGLGKLLHELMTGELPAHEPPDGRFRPVVVKAARQRPDQRYRSVSDMLAALEQAAAVPNNWQTLEDTAERLADQLRNEVPDDLAIAELVDLVLGDNKTQDALDALKRAIPWMSMGAIGQLWDRDPGALRDIVARYGAFVTPIRWDFDFCDVIADFFDRCVLVTSDNEILRVALKTLMELGATHNRWHLRDVAIGILQRLREPEAALAACEALRETSAPAVSWTLSAFVVRSLHPAIRDVVEQIEADARDTRTPTPG